jgi:Lar family restriction alleviation protein
MEKSEKIASMKPCPFCGSSDLGIEVMEGLNQKPLFWIQCQGCRVSTRPNADSRAAVSDWNRRAKPLVKA